MKRGFFISMLAVAACEPAKAADPLRDVEAIAAGHDRTCALRDGRVYCWGATRGGDRAPRATQVAGLTGIDFIAAAGSRVCTLGTAGDLYCWGEDPGVERIDLGARIVRMAVGPDHICAKTEHRDLYCWGSGGGGALAQPTPPGRAALVAEGVDEVEVGPGWICHRATGKETCLGARPRADGLSQQQVRQGSGNRPTACGLSVEGDVVCDGRRVEGVSDVVALAVGRDLTCARAVYGSVWCWGEAGARRRIALRGTARQLAVGDAHACALLEEDRTVQCWSATGEPIGVTADEKVAAGAPAPAIPTTLVAEAIARYRRIGAFAPESLEGSVWSVCVSLPDAVVPCEFCRHTLRFEQGGRFVAETTCKDPRYDEKTTGTWERTGATVRAHEGAGTRTYAAEWTLEIRGTELAGQRAVQRSDWPVQTVRGALAP